MIGHAGTRSQLERDLPAVLLLYGPPHIGKKTLVEHLISFHGFPRENVVRNYQGLTAGQAQYLRRNARTFSLDGQGKVFATCLDFLASDAAGHALLKVIEEPPPGVHFLMTASQPVLLTIASRSQVHMLGLLSKEEVIGVLVSKGMTPEAARTLAPHGRGQVRPALAYQLTQAERQRVVAALKAVAADDASLLERSLRQWDEETHRLLRVWAVEASTQRWAIFGADPALKLGKTDAHILLAELSRAGVARPALAAAVALGSLAKARRPG